MEQKSYKKLGQFILCLSVLCSFIIIFQTVRSDNLKDYLLNSSFISSILSTITFIIIIIGGLSLKVKYPKYYKYQLFSGIIMLSTNLIFDIIPRVIYSIS